MLARIFNTIKQIIKNEFAYVWVLVIIAVLTHRQWFKLSSNLFFHDWRYRTNEAVAQIFPFGMSSWLSFSGLGSQNIQPYSFVPTFVWGLLGNYAIATKISHFIPIAILSLVTPYLLFKKLAKNKHAAFLAALFYAFNTYLITRSFAHLPIALVNALFPGIVLLFINFLENRSWRNAICFSLVFSLGCVYEIRVMYIICFALALLTSLNVKNLVSTVRSDVAKWLGIALVIILLNAFWIMTTLRAGTSAISAIANRGLWGSDLITLLHIISLSNWNWTLGKYETEFVVQPIPVYAWIFPIVAVLSLLLAKSKIGKNYKYVIFGGIISIFGILLSKQADEPFPSLYAWLYTHFPGFNLFRESSKFNILVGFGYSLLVAFSISTISKIISSKKLKSVLFVALCIFPLINAKRLITEEAGATFSSQVEPAEYVSFKKILRDDSSVYFRTLWIPFYHQWGYFDLFRPKVSAWDELGQNKAFAALAGLPVNLANFKNPKLYTGFLEKSYGQDVLSLMSIKYIVVPKQLPSTVENIFPYAGQRLDYVNELDKVSYLEKNTIGGINLYKNSQAGEPIFTFAKMLNLPSTANLDRKYTFIKNALKSKLLFTTRSVEGDKDALTEVEDVFENISSTDIAKDGVVVKSPRSVSFNSEVYSQKDEGLKAVFRWNRGFLSADTVKGGLLLVNGKAVSTSNDQKTVVLSNTWLGLNLDLFVLKGEELTPIKPGSDTVVARLEESPTFGIYKLDSNKVLNPSFEAGSWQATVGDCDRYDDKPAIAMTLNRANKTDGRQSLQLEAMRHVACVSTKVDFSEQGEYLMAFDYQSPNAQKIGYYLSFDDVQKTVVSETPSLTSTDWQTYSKKITTPKGATSVKIYLYSYSTDQKTNIITRYDDIRFGRLVPIKIVPTRRNEVFEKNSSILKAENEFKYQDTSYSYLNLFTNGSFESGLWQRMVGDCKKYDDQPKIAMTTTTQEKTDGSYALELSATRHTACTLTTVPVKSGSTYLASFDYQSPNAKTASYYIGFNDPEKSSLKGDLQITGQAWQMFSDTITVPKGATSLSFYVYAKETDKKTNIINRYDNFKLIEVPDLRDSFYLVSEPTSTLVEPTSIAFDLINPTKKQVHIKGATTPFFLGMSESYHDQWQLQVRNEKIEGWLRRWSPFAKPDRVGDAYHYKLNGFLNAWYVDTEDLCVKQEKCTKNPDGSYDIEMTIEFWPQRWFYLGLLISGTTLAGCLGYLAFDGVRILRRKRKAKQTTV